MNTTTDTRDPEEIQREIHRTQDEMSRTVSQIGDQLTVRSFVNALLDKADENDVDARRLLNGARRNPLALGLISVGTIWLLSEHDARASSFTSSGSTRGWGEDDYDPDHRGYVDHMSRFERRSDEDEPSYLRRRDEHRGTYLMIERGHEEDHKSYRDRLDEATERMRQRRDHFAEGARQRRDRLASASRSGARRVKGAYKDNPLIGGLAAAFVGAIAGAAIPATRTEREYLGEQGARALDKAGEKAREYGEEARHKKDEMVDRADRQMSGDRETPGQTSTSSATTAI